MQTHTPIHISRYYYVQQTNQIIVLIEYTAHPLHHNNTVHQNRIILHEQCNKQQVIAIHTDTSASTDTTLQNSFN